jgi:gliding motility-associated-like protein
VSLEGITGENITWIFPGGEPGSAAGPIAGPVCYRQPGKYSVTAIVNLGSCAVEITDSVEVCVPDIIPNAFTPDGDQINDVFRPVLYFPTVDYHFEIFNRWGQRVFGTTDPQQGWDGKYSGLDAPSDVYVWMLRYTEVRDENTRQARSRKGDLQLLR